MSSPASASRPRGGLSRRQALAGFGIALVGGVSAPAASARAAVAPARHARAGFAAGLANLQLAGQRVIGSYPGLTPPASLFTDISNGQVAGVIFFGENISSEAQIAGVITQLRQAQAQSPVQVPLLLMTDQEGGLVRRLPGQPVLSEKQIGQSSDPVAAAAAAGTGAGQNLAGVGMNVNLAPVLDVYYKTGNFIDQYQRSYSNDPAVVSECGQAFITAQQQTGVAATAKHSPAWARPPRTRTPTTGRSP
jgi:beta-N-acetylhexosaminidase